MQAHDAGEMYFIALQPPPALSAQITAIKQGLADRWGLRHALRSPPHITLRSPFRWTAEQRTSQAPGLQHWAATQRPVHIELNGFDCFAPRVLFIRVEDNPALRQLQQGLMQHLILSGAAPAEAHPRPFHPHLTLAHRDLTPTLFARLWPRWETRAWQAHFCVESVDLLCLHADGWRVHSAWPLLNRD